MRIFAGLIWMFVLSTALLAEQDEPAKGEKKKRIATAFDEPLYLEQIAPAGSEAKERELSPKEYEQWLRKSHGRRVYELIWRRALGRYVEEHQIGVSDQEIKGIISFVERRIESEPESPIATTFTPDERKGVMVAWSRGILMDWKVCRSLHEKYGGRVGIGSLGAWTAFDAQNELLVEHERQGEIEFHDAEMEQAYRDHMKISNFADAYPKGERLKKLLKTPPHLHN